MTDVDIAPGEDAIFEVHVCDEPELDWYKDGILIEDEGRFIIEDPIEDDILYRLTIEKCQPSDRGTYTCYIRNDCGEARCSAQLMITEPLEGKFGKPHSFKKMSMPEWIKKQPEKPVKFGKEGLKSYPKELVEKSTNVLVTPEKAKVEVHSIPDEKDEVILPPTRDLPLLTTDRDPGLGNKNSWKKPSADIPHGKRKTFEAPKPLASKPKFLKEMKGGRVS